MQLQELTTDIENIAQQGADVTITGLTADSREVRAGYLFAALPGVKVDGCNFIAQAVAQGAVAVLAPAGTDVAGATLIAADNPRRAFAQLAQRFFGKQPETVVAVTGTNGKSSTVNFCRQIWQMMDHAAASLGTIGITAHLKDKLDINRPGLLTTPDPVVLHAEIAELEAAGVTHLALEASSIGLDQYRMDGLQLTAAGFSNLTRDHLDYHGDMATYAKAKLRLFSELLPAHGVAVVMTGTPMADDILAVCKTRGIRTITVGAAGSDIALNVQKPLAAGQFIDITVFGERYALELPLVGRFQADNALLALGLVIAEDPDNRMLHMQAVQALERLQPVRGRLELAATLPNGAAIYVDYAHTPDGLETLLHSLRPHAHRALHVVFGCGGDRDRGKRPMMGEIAARLADHVIVTDDNPRTEDAATIRADVMAGCSGNSKTENIGGRRDAIRHAAQLLQAGDVLVVAGKGHEQGQIVGSTILPFDDVTEAQAAAQEQQKTRQA